ncbi:MAG: signal recognition particle receptor subunit alpha [Nanoarchaeota archaeon]|nr:signal recognition particle receptor subunit alpha [Nanoarchaeota archaeon]
MVLESLSEKLKESLRKITKSIFVDKRVIEDLVKDLQRSLLSADVDVQLVFDLTEKIKQRALEEKPPKTISQKEFLIKIVYEELVNFLGKEKSEIKIERKKPFKIMMVGLFGNGKTTLAQKLAKYYSKRNYKVATLGLDVHRPSAPEQLQQLSKQINIPCFINPEEKDPIKIYKQFEKEYKKYDILIIDTAGRDALSDDLIQEIESLKKEINPDETVLVFSADIGQDLKNQAEAFKKACNITSIVVTKMDGTAKGGGALVGAASTGAKIKFLGTGEKPEDLEPYIPERFVSRLLGMGDLETLLEKAKEAISDEEAKDLGKKFLKGEFNLLDLYEQMEAMKKMGPISKVMEMIPGFSQLKLPKDALQVQEGKLKKWRIAMNSMTKEELERPDEVMSTERINRISKGSGIQGSEIRDLIKQHKTVKKMMKMMKGKDPSKLMKKFKLPGM